MRALKISTRYSARPWVKDIAKSEQHCKEVGHEILIARKASKQVPLTVKHQTVLLLEHDHRVQDVTNSDASALFQQAAVFLLAGASPAITLTVTCFHILKSEHIKEQLRNELDALKSSTSEGIFAPEFGWRRLTRLRYLVSDGHTLSDQSQIFISRITECCC